jgi:hypothetical protein
MNRICIYQGQTKYAAPANFPQKSKLNARRYRMANIKVFPVKGPLLLAFYKWSPLLTYFPLNLLANFSCPLPLPLPTSSHSSKVLNYLQSQDKDIFYGKFFREKKIFNSIYIYRYMTA